MSGEDGRPLKTQRRQEHWRVLVEQARAQVQAGLRGRELPAPEGVMRQLREERDAQLMAMH